MQTMATVSSPGHCSQNPGQLWNSTDLASYLVVLTIAHCDNDTHTHRPAVGDFPEFSHAGEGAGLCLQSQFSGRVKRPLSHPNRSLQVKTLQPRAHQK